MLNADECGFCYWRPRAYNVGLGPPTLFRTGNWIQGGSSHSFELIQTRRWYYLCSTIGDHWAQYVSEERVGGCLPLIMALAKNPRLLANNLF